jgi:hypothetical protein
MTRLAQLIAQNEGFGPSENRPTRDHNPGDLKHAPGITGWDGTIGIEPSDDQGWADLERQLQLYAQRGLTLQEMVNEYLGFAKDAPLNTSVVDGNNRVPYLNTICTGLHLPPEALVSVALEIPAIGPGGV